MRSMKEEKGRGEEGGGRKRRGQGEGEAKGGGEWRKMMDGTMKGRNGMGEWVD